MTYISSKDAAGLFRRATRSGLLLIAVALSLSAGVDAQQGRGHAGGARTREARGGRLPRFEDYPAGEIYRGRVAPVVLGDRRARLFRTRLQEDSRAGANFAGRYRVVYWGCGTGCAQMAVVDARTGRVYWPPLEYIDIPDPEEDPGRGRGWRLDSRLLVLTKNYYDSQRSFTAYYYVFERNRFRLLRKAQVHHPTEEQP